MLKEQKNKDVCLSPKLLGLVIDKASYEDDSHLQELWAKLISSSKNENEADTLFLGQALSIMSSREANFFVNFCNWSTYDFIREPSYSELQNDYIAFVQMHVAMPLPSEVPLWNEYLSKLWNGKFFWPARIISAQVDSISEQNIVHRPYYTSRDYNIHRKEYDILEMAGLLKKSLYSYEFQPIRHSFSTHDFFENVDYSVTSKGSFSLYEVSKIGLELYSRISIAQ